MRYSAEQIVRWDEASEQTGFKVGPVDRASNLPQFWNEAQADEWAERGFPDVGVVSFEFPFAVVLS